MDGYVERMKNEYRELADKIVKLSAFIHADNDAFDSLDKLERVRMIEQLTYMQSYCRVLDSRLWVARGNKEHS